MPWRILSDIPIDDAAILEAYESWKERGSTQLVLLVRKQIDRERMISTAQEQKEEVIVLPAPNWSISLQSDATFLQHQLPPQAIQTKFHSQYNYSNDDIDRAKTFLKDVIRVYISRRQLDHSITAAPRPLVYPTHDQQPAMTDDQWRPFAAWMRQSRLRVLAESKQQSCDQLLMTVSGEGGTGKSWLIQHILHDIKIVFGTNNAKQLVVLMAHQGSAAYLIGGRTISSTLALPGQCNFRTPYFPLTATPGGQTSLSRIQNEMDQVHLIVVDEYGVISCGMMNWIDQRLREIFPHHRQLPFGGRDVLFTGDPGQLGPVSPSSLSTPIDILGTDSERAGRNVWKAIPTFYCLRQQNRGISDPSWYDMLRRVRKGKATDEDINLVNSRTVPLPVSLPSSTIHLAYRNCDVDEANEAALRRSGQPVFHFDAQHNVCRAVLAETQPSDTEAVQQLLQDAQEMTSASAKCLPLHINLAIGAPVVLTFNLEQRVGLCNGTRAHVFDIDDDRSPSHLPLVLLQVEDYHGPSFLGNVCRIVPIVCRTASLMSSRECAFRVSRTTLPLRLGFATTIHKIQGQTCTKVVFNPSNLRNSALAYVALSRVRSRNDIFLTKPLSKSQFQKTPKAQHNDEQEDDRLTALEEKTHRNLRHVISAIEFVAATHNQEILTH